MSNRIWLFLLAAAAFSLTAAGIITFRHPEPAAGPEPEGAGTSGAMQALDDWSRARAYPFNDIPPDAYMKAYEADRSSMKKLSKSPLAGATWEPIGPLDSDSRGRSISVAINPLNVNTVYCGSASGGLWRTRQASLGGDWARIPLGFPALGIGAIVIDPADTNTMYVGTGEVYRYGVAVGGLILRTTRGSYGVGILKSTNAGATWTKSLDWTYDQQHGVQQIKINPSNRNTLVAATTEGIYRSFDRGSTWSPVLPVAMATDVVYNRKDTTQLLAACGNFNSLGRGIYRSDDGGTNWILTAGGQSVYTGKALLDAYYSNSSTVYASVADSTTSFGSLWRSVDFGATWTQINTDAIFGVQGWYSHFVAVKPTDSSKIVHAGLSAYKSANGGITFAGSAGGYSDNHNYAYEPGHPDILYIVNDNGIFRSSNFGDSFTNVGNGMQTLQFYNGFSNSSSDSLLALGQVQDHIPGYLYNGSISWVRSASDECGWTGIDPTNDFIMYAANRGDETGTSIAKSTNRGSSFFGSGSFTGPAAWNSPFVIAPSSTNILYFGSAYIYRSTTAAGSWTVTNSGVSLDGNPALSMAISSTSPDTVVVGMAPYVAPAHIFLTTNAGASWVNITGTLPNRYPMDLAINPMNTKTVYATFGGFGSGHVFKSTNLGGAWTDITGSLPDAPTPAVLVDPVDTSVIFVGNDFGVYISTNSGASWSGYSEGLPEAVICADLSMNLSAHKLRVATHGNGVYERNVIFGGVSLDFDYKAFGLTAPANASEVLLGSAVSPLKASFRNNGALAQSDPFDVKFRILQGTTELYSSTQNIAGLALAEIRQVTFAGSFTPTDTGTYKIQAISLAADQEPANDTLNGTLRVILPPSITLLSVSKQGCTYTPIVGGTAGPAGDDVQKRVGLPFAFVFNGVAYDSMQISTNGWAEFGTGTPGSLYGLSTAGQIGPLGANENGRMGTIQHPTKVLGIWWDDMNTDPPGSSVTYTTQGLSPNRTFVVQWKDIRAYYDAGSTTTLLNFQLRLHEGTNIAEYDYGSITAGTFGGSDIGAMIGTKDEYGGDYHYFDIAAKKTGLASDVTTDLSPLTNWPGPDSCYQIQPAQNLLTAGYAAGWNMVSIPLLQSSYAVASLFPSALNGRAFDYTGGAYQIRDSLVPGRGYWTKLPGNELRFFTGDSYSSDSLPLQKGWNMIGSLDHDVPAPSGGIIATAMYGYSGSYHLLTVVKPGKAYWIKTSAAGVIPFGPAALPQAATSLSAFSMTGNPDFSSYTHLTLTDGLGRTQHLYIADDPEHRIPAGYFEMPPSAPDGPDMRFASQNLVETVTDTRPHEFPVKVDGVEYPLTISWHIASASASVSLIVGKNAHPMAGDGLATIGAGDGPISVSYSGGAPLPAEFTLAQNYPNPFNPKTRIEFTLPSAAKVAIRVYNILGEEVATLIDQSLDAGYRSVDWDASNMPSGLYVYRITAGTFSASRKMLLLK